MADASCVVDVDGTNAPSDKQREREIHNHPGCKTKSEVWKVFGFYKLDEHLPVSKRNLDLTSAVCRLCRKSYKNTGNTTNFKSHIINEHTPAAAHNGPKSKPSVLGSTTKSSSSTMGIQPTLPVVFASKVTKLGIDRKTKIDEALLKLIVGKVLPPSLVDNEYFRDFVKALEPRYIIPGRKTVLACLEARKEQVEQRLKDEIQDCAGVGITHDGWTSSATESYNTTTIHYIQKDWKLKSAALNTIKMVGSHTSEKIAESVEVTKIKWGLPHCVATTDNAANEKKAFQLLNMQRFGCFGHKINLTIKTSLVESKEIAKLLGKGRRLVTLLHTSSSVNDKLLEKQKLLLTKGIGHKLIADVQTRWNSSLFMLDRLLEQMPPLMAVATDETVSKTARTTMQNCLFTFEETTLAEKLVKLLQPFHKATEVVCAEKVPTINKILPVIAKLKIALKEEEDDPVVIKSLKSKMLQDLEKRSEDDLDLALLGCILSPYTKGFEFMPHMRTKAEELLRSMMNVVHPTVKVKTEKDNTEIHMDDSLEVLPSLPVLPELSESNDEVEHEVKENEVGNETPPPKKLKSADMEDWLSDIVCIGDSQLDQSDVIQAEISRYLATVLREGDQNSTVLEWWQRNEVFFPRISVIAGKILCVQASSVSSERVFSLAGELVSKKRSRLHSDNVDLFIFLNKNIKTLW